jgi:ribosomal protein S18 acetylase RimI-like enzyme
MNTDDLAVVHGPTSTSQQRNTAMPVAHRRARAHEVRIRIGRDADLPEVRTIVARAYRQYERVLGAELFSRYLDDVLDLDRHRTRGQLLVAELHGTICGAVVYYPEASLQGVGWPDGWASGRALAVDTPARGLGVAEALTRDVQRRARADGAPVFAFHTAAFMHGARALYDRLGFERAPEFDADLRDYLDPALDCPVPALAYLRRLDSGIDAHREALAS